MIEVQIEFIAKTTIRIISYVYDEDDSLVDPTTSIKLTLNDKDGVQKAGYISVVASASFTTGLVVTGGTSGATGLVVSKPDGTTLEIQQVTGVWQSGEGITDTGAGTSTTTSALLGADMTHEAVPQTGIYEYFYKTTTLSTKGWWHGEVVVIDGTAPDDYTSLGVFSIRVK